MSKGNISEFVTGGGKGTITSVTIDTLDSLLPEEVDRDKWRKYDEEGKTPKLDRDHYAVKWVCDDLERTDYILIPATMGGYMKSKVKVFLDRNGLGGDPDAWPGKEVIVKYTSEGYPRLAL